MLDVERMLDVEKGAELARRAYTLLELHGVEKDRLMSYDPPDWHFYQTRHGVLIIYKLKHLYNDSKDRCEVEREHLDEALVALRKMMVLEDVADA
jgi:hypothetical protein